MRSDRIQADSRDRRSDLARPRLFAVSPRMNPGRRKRSWWNRLGLEKEDLFAFPMALMVGVLFMLLSSGVYSGLASPEPAAGNLAGVVLKSGSSVFTAPAVLVRQLLGW